MSGPSGADGPAAPPPPAVRPTFRILDAVLVWLFSNLVVAVVLAFGLAAGAEAEGPFLFGVLIPVQVAATVAGIAYVSRRRGSGSLEADFGLAATLRDGWGLAYGVALLFAAGLVTYPILELFGREDDPGQQVIEEFQDAAGTGVVLGLIAIAVLAPVAEELLFRGLLLEALRRRMSDIAAVVVGGVAFGLVHLLDPGAALRLPALALLGIVLGFMKVRTGRLGMPILAHVGFNLTSTLVILAA